MFQIQCADRSDSQSSESSQNRDTEQDIKFTGKELAARANTVSLITILRNYGIRIDSGNNKIVCPFDFHKGGRENTPSFYYYPDTNTFYCFGCKSGTKPINFVMLMEDISFSKALYKILNCYASEISTDQIEAVSNVNYSEKLSILMDFSDSFRPYIQAAINDPVEMKRLEDLTSVFDKMNEKYDLDNVALKSMANKLKAKLIK